jgi:hypothetical protein
MASRQLRSVTHELAAAKCEPATEAAESATPPCLDDADEPAPAARFCRVCFAPLANGASLCSDRCRGNHQRLMPAPNHEQSWQRWASPGRPRPRAPSHRNYGRNY